jgi:hypothetical protein
MVDLARHTAAKKSMLDFEKGFNKRIVELACHSPIIAPS